tara:strand:+ start:298 stop:882 length:585 start_codon:yes stop_codon:yes gene_type:complete
MAEKDKGKKFLEDVIAGSEGDPTTWFNHMRGDFNMPEPVPPTVNFSHGMKPGMEDLAPFGEGAEQRLNSVKEAERMNTISPLGDFAEQRVNTVKDAEEDRFKKMQMLNGNTFENGERSQGDQEAEQRMVQNKVTGLLQKFVGGIKDFIQRPIMPDNRVKDPISGKMVDPNFLKLLENRPDLRKRFDETGSIYGD